MNSEERMNAKILMMFHKQMVKRVKERTGAHTVMHVKGDWVNGKKINYLLIRSKEKEVRVGAEHSFDDYTAENYEEAINEFLKD